MQNLFPCSSPPFSISLFSPSLSSLSLSLSFSLSCPYFPFLHPTLTPQQKHPLLQTLLSLPQEPLEEDRLSPAEIDQLIGEILKSFEDPEVTKDPLMSPALAPDKMLIGLPIVHLVVRGGGQWAKKRGG